MVLQFKKCARNDEFPVFLLLGRIRTVNLLRNYQPVFQSGHVSMLLEAHIPLCCEDLEALGLFL